MEWGDYDCDILFKRIHTTSEEEDISPPRLYQLPCLTSAERHRYLSEGGRGSVAPSRELAQKVELVLRSRGDRGRANKYLLRVLEEL